MPISAAQEVVRSQPSPLPVVYRDRRQPVTRLHRQEQHRNPGHGVLITQPVTIVAHLRDSPDDAVHAVREESVEGASETVGVETGELLEEQRVALFFRLRRDRFESTRRTHQVEPGSDDAQATAATKAEVARDDVRRIAHLGDRATHLGSRLAGDVWLLVQNAGHGLR